MLPENSPAIFSGYPLSFVEQLTSVYDSLEDIDCEAYSRLCSNLLSMHSISHDYCGGECRYSPGDQSDSFLVAPHFWVTLTSEQGELWLIDYRLQHNVPFHLVPPHGVFSATTAEVVYTGKRGGMLTLDPQTVALLSRGFVMGSPPEMRHQVRQMKQKCADSWR